MAKVPTCKVPDPLKMHTYKTKPQMKKNFVLNNLSAVKSMFGTLPLLSGETSAACAGYTVNFTFKLDIF